MSDRAQAVISKDAVYHNLRIVKKLAPNSNVLAMVKGNAYGHGLVAIGKILEDIDGLGVACLEEAMLLRQGSVNTPIVLMSGVYSVEDLKLVDLFNLQMVVHDPYQVKLLQNNTLPRPIKTWIKIDTGMHRLGFSPKQFKDAYQQLANNHQIHQPLTIMTHLANADNLQKEGTLEQLEVFDRVTSKLQGPKSIANSAGLMSWPKTIAHWNRPGIMLYGISPMLNELGTEYGLRPAMTLKSKVLALHDLQKGDSVGYGSAWTCPQAMRIAVVAIGYGDGYPRHAQNGCPVLIRDKVCPLVGRVSMDMITVDVTHCPDVMIGDPVILWGDGLPVETVAKYADTIAYELLCNVSRRVTYSYLS